MIVLPKNDDTVDAINSMLASTDVSFSYEEKISVLLSSTYRSEYSNGSFSISSLTVFDSALIMSLRRRNPSVSAAEINTN